ncbi:MAG: NAD(P)-dependent oxidoreductase [Bifidobacteriaceae bacterium]|jgi:3-hydroxyisobutyrate dehydrogenase|nr:NAD(P)-dependent oxidoreductase [Bifidobacteriaceae bacterium]
MTANGVAVLGLGAMGLAMAKRLDGQFAVRGFDPAPERRALAEGVGLMTCDTAADAVQAAGVVVLAVRNEAQVDEVLFGPAGIAAQIEADGVVVLTSTVGIEAARRAGSRLALSGIGLVDAPVSGGPARAERGDLLIAVGAAPADWHAAEPVVRALGSTVAMVGGAPGAGQALKTVNQLLCGVHIAAAAEALTLAKALDLDPGQALEALGSGAAASFMLADRGPRILEVLDGGDPAVFSREDIFVKDMGIVGEAARARSVATPLAGAAHQVYLLAQAAGLAARDDSTVARLLAP